MLNGLTYVRVLGLRCGYGV